MQKQGHKVKVAGLRVLIAEPEPDIQHLYRSFLNGWAVDIVDTGDKCIERLSEAADHALIDMVVIDSHVGGIGAIECIRKIRQIFPDQRLIVTSTTSTNFKQEAKQAGLSVNEIPILEKPFSFTQLLSLATSRIHRTRKIGLHDHVLAIYETPDEEFDEAIRFLSDVKNNAETALFVVRSEYDIDSLKARMRVNKGIDVDSLISDGSLVIVRNEDWYIPDKKVDKNRIIEQWNRLVSRSLSEGKKGLRAFCMMDCFFEHGFSEEVVDYEHALPAKFQMPFVPICAYRKQDIDLLTEDQKRRLILCHNHVWTGNNREQ